MILPVQPRKCPALTVPLTQSRGQPPSSNSPRSSPTSSPSSRATPGLSFPQLAPQHVPPPSCFPTQDPSGQVSLFAVAAAVGFPANAFFLFSSFLSPFLRQSYPTPALPGQLGQVNTQTLPSPTAVNTEQGVGGTSIPGHTEARNREGAGTSKKPSLTRNFRIGPRPQFLFQ